MCIERRFVPLGNTFLNDQQEQALIAAFEANRYLPKQESPVPTQQASPRTPTAQQQDRPQDVSAQGSARRRAYSAPSSTSRTHDEEAHVESRSLSMPILNGGDGDEPEAAVNHLAEPSEKAEMLPTPLRCQIFSTTPLPQVPSWPQSAQLEQQSNFMCEHPPLHQQENSQMMNLGTGVCANVADWGVWATPMEPTLSGFVPATSMMIPQVPPVLPPVHHSAHSPLHAPPLAATVHVPSPTAHQPQSPTSDVGVSQSAAGARNRRRGAKRAGTASQQNSPLMLSEMLQDPSSRDVQPPATAESNHHEDGSMITATIIERLAAGKGVAPALPFKAGEPWLGGVTDAVSAGGNVHATSCKFQEKLSPAREMLRQRGQSLLMQCLSA